MATDSARELTAGDLAGLIGEIPQHIDDYKASKIEQWPVRSNRASELGHPCERFLTYNRVAWRHARLPDVGLQYVFDEGRRSEEHALEDLRKAGYTILEGQRSFEWPDKQITGAIDGKILLPKNHPHPRAVPIEIKSTNPYDWERITSVADLVNSQKMWLRKIPAQITTYLLLNASEEIGALMMRNRSTGQYKTLPVMLDYQLAETMVAKAERVNARIALIYAAGGIPESGIVPEAVDALLPERIPFDQDICLRCNYFALCLPDVFAKQSAEVVDDTELASMLDRRAELAPFSDEYDSVDRAIKKRVGDRDRVIVGNWLVTSEMRTRKGFTTQDTTFRVYKIAQLKTAEGAR